MTAETSVILALACSVIGGIGLGMSIRAWADRVPKHVHKWSKWDIVEMTYSNAILGSQIDVTRQMRTCEECKFRETARID